MNNVNGKPLCLRIEDARSDIAAVINRHRAEGLPCFILEPILKDFYTQIASGKAAELEMVRRDYEAKTESEVT